MQMIKYYDKHNKLLKRGYIVRLSIGNDNLIGIVSCYKKQWYIYCLYHTYNGVQYDKECIVLGNLPYVVVDGKRTLRDVTIEKDKPCITECIYNYSFIYSGKTRFKDKKERDFWVGYMCHWNGCIYNNTYCHLFLYKQNSQHKDTFCNYGCDFIPLIIREVYNDRCYYILSLFTPDDETISDMYFHKQHLLEVKSIISKYYKNNEWLQMLYRKDYISHLHKAVSETS